MLRNVNAVFPKGSILENSNFIKILACGKCFALRAARLGQVYILALPTLPLLRNCNMFSHGALYLLMSSSALQKLLSLLSKAL